MPYPKLRQIVRWHRKGMTVKEIAWAVDEEPAVVREALDYHRTQPQRKRARKQLAIENREAVETAWQLLAAGYPLDVIVANFGDVITREELARV